MPTETPPPSEIKPKIDDQFWFDLSADMIKGSVERIDKASDKIREMVVWAYGIYTASSIFTVEFKKIEEWWILAVLTIPYFFLLIVYWQSLVAQNPVSINFDPRSPTLIQEAYSKTFNSKSEKLRELTSASYVSIFVLAVSLMVAYFLKNNQKEIPLTDNYFSGKFFPKDSTGNKLLIVGKFPKDDTLLIEINKFFLSGKSLTSKDTSFIILNSHEGITYQNYFFDATIEKVSLKILWNENNFTKSLEKVFILKASKKN